MTRLEEKGRDLELECRAAISLLKQAEPAPTPELISLVDHAERTIVGVRDALIGELRGSADEWERGRIREWLDHVNTTLSVVASLEYPAAVLREHIGEACGELEKAFAGVPRWPQPPSSVPVAPQREPVRPEPEAAERPIVPAHVEEPANLEESPLDRIQGVE